MSISLYVDNCATGEERRRTYGFNVFNASMQCVYMSKYLYMCVLRHGVYICGNVCIYVCVCASQCIYVCKCIYVCHSLYMCVNVCMYIHAVTHTLDHFPQ